MSDKKEKKKKVNNRKNYQKGKDCQVETRSLLLEYDQTLSKEDIKIPDDGVNGEDLIMNDKARRSYPISIENKNRKRIKFKAAIDQAEINAKKSGYPGAVVFRQDDMTDIMIMMKLKDWLDIYRKEKTLRRIARIENLKRLVDEE